MGNISHDLCANALSYLADPFEIDDAGVCRCAADQELWPVFFREPLQFVIVDLFSIAINTVVGDFLIDPRKIKRMSMRQMTAVR